MRFYIKKVRRDIENRGGTFYLDDEDIDLLMGHRYGTFYKKKMSAQGARKDMADNGRIDDISTYTEAIAKARIDAFNRNYDEGKVKEVKAFAARSKSKQAARELKEYKTAAAEVAYLREKFNL